MRATTLFVVLLAFLLAAPTTAAADPGPSGRQSYTGTIDGADYRVEMPERWNGTLVLFSHGYYPEQFGAPEEIMLSTAPKTAEWLLENGYAIAASNYEGAVGLAVESALRDQIALLDWFGEHLGRPRRTISNGMSMGGGIAIELAERNPHRFAGVLAQCSDYDQQGTWNIALDVNFAVRTLLTDDDTIELVRVGDPEAATQALRDGIAAARGSAQGRAKLALIGALANIPGWASAHDPEPTDLDTRIERTTDWIDGAYVWGMGPGARADIERRAGGNPSWNVGIDYGRQLGKSSRQDLVAAAYQRAGLDVADDLAELAAAPRIAPDPRALAYMYRYTVPRGTTPVPVVTLHNTQDGGASSDQAGWYADQVERAGDPAKLRQVFVGRGNHCAFSAAEEITALRAVERRAATGHWPDTRPGRLNEVAGRFGPGYHDVLDLFDGTTEAMPPAFTPFQPAEFLRPSR